MSTRIKLQGWLVMAGLVSVGLACSLLNPTKQPTQSAPQGAPAQGSPTQVSSNLSSSPSPGMADSAPSGQIQQWANDAVASSEWGSSDWTARQATSKPDTLECGDIGTAWAAASQDTVEWINLYFKLPVYPTEIRIHQTYNPDQVDRVDLIDMQGQFVTVYNSHPRKVDNPCPYKLIIPVNRSDILAQGVRITIDQSVLDLGWNEIDAVEIVGVAGQGTPVRPPVPTP